MYNIVVSDLDGSLLGADHKLNEYTKNVVRKFIDSGYTFILATGRSIVDAKRIKQEINRNISIIASNGAEVLDEDSKLIYRQELDKNILMSLLDIDYKKNKDVYINIITADKWYVLEEYPKDHPIHAWVEPDWSYELINKNEISNLDVLKIFYVGENKDLKDIEKKVLAAHVDKINHAFTLTTCFEIFPKNVTKAIALKKLSELKNIDLSKAIAFGDGFNDVEMLKLVKKGYVMANAPENLKNHLDNLELVQSNSENGVANKMIEIFNLEV